MSVYGEDFDTETPYLGRGKVPEFLWVFGSPLALTNARNVLSSTVGKLYARCLPTAAVPALVAGAAGVQFWAVPGGGTDLPSICI